MYSRSLGMHFIENSENREKWPSHMNVMAEGNGNNLYRTVHCMAINVHVSRILPACAVTINDETNMLIYLTTISCVPRHKFSRLATWLMK
jgi:hypothetical protein